MAAGLDNNKPIIKNLKKEMSTYLWMESSSTKCLMSTLKQVNIKREEACVKTLTLVMKFIGIPDAF